MRDTTRVPEEWIKDEEKVREEFYENFVRFGILNDMQNRPMFYDTKTDDLDKVINFLLKQCRIFRLKGYKDRDNEVH